MAQRAALDETGPMPGGTATPRMGLHALLCTAAERHPERLAFADAGDKAAWSGRPAMPWTFGNARELVGRLAAALRSLDLPPGSAVGIHLAGTSEASLALLAVEAAGFLPCLLPIVWDDARLGRAAEAARLRAILTQGMVGTARPAEAACRAAFGYFGLRFVAAFGPHLPDGVISLDRAILDHRPDLAPPGMSAGFVTFAEGDPARPIHRDGDALAAAAALHLVAARVEGGERIVSLLPPSDLRGLVTGLAAALLAGATLECHPLPSGRTLADILERGGPCHLVLPDWMEERLAGGALPAPLRSLTYVHRAPTRFAPPAGPRARILDAIAFDETALLSARRDHRDLASVLAAPERLAGSAGLIGVRRTPDGTLAFRGPASRAVSLHRSAQGDADAEDWQLSRFRAEVENGRAIAVALA